MTYLPDLPSPPEEPEEQIDPVVQASFDRGDFASFSISNFFPVEDVDFMDSAEYQKCVEEFEAYSLPGTRHMRFELVDVNTGHGSVVGVFTGRDLSKEIMKLNQGAIPAEDVYYFRPCPSGVVYSIFDPDCLLVNSGCPHRDDYSVFYSEEDMHAAVDAVDNIFSRNTLVVIESYGNERCLYTLE